MEADGLDADEDGPVRRATARSGPRRFGTATRWLLWSARILLIALLVVAYVDERRTAGLQSAPLEEGRTWHDRTLEFAHAIEDRFWAAILMAFGGVVIGLASIGCRLFPDFLADALLVALGGLSAVDAFFLRALGFT